MAAYVVVGRVDYSVFVWAVWACMHEIVSEIREKLELVIRRNAKVKRFAFWRATTRSIVTNVLRQLTRDSPQALPARLRPPGTAS